MQPNDLQLTDGFEIKEFRIYAYINNMIITIMSDIILKVIKVGKPKKIQINLHKPKTNCNKPLRQYNITYAAHRLYASIGV